MMSSLLLITPLVINFDEGFEAEELLNVAIGVFALILMVLSLSAYRRTRLSRLLIVSAAFGLFAVEVVITQLDFFVFTLGFETEQIITTFMDFVILLLFFFAVIRK